VKRFWALFFMFWPILACYVCWIAPSMGWWFPSNGPTGMKAASPLGERIDDLFYMILYIVTATFIGTQVALGYVLLKGAAATDEGNTEKSWYTHGSHNLEVIWTIVPACVLLFIALYQMDVWAEYRVKDSFPGDIKGGKVHSAVAEVTARQFEWRIRYPGFGPDGQQLTLMPKPQPTDLYTVNDLHVVVGTPAMIILETQDVQHSFFLPELRIKQDAVPGLDIPVWFEASASGEYTLLCAELCGWGHYKMKARMIAETKEQHLEFLKNLSKTQNFDGVPDSSEVAAPVATTAAVE
jgi:cytochrome c oxidase subunit II